MEWTPVRRVSLAEEVADQLISAIVTGQFALGDRLPPERELAALFQVARPTIREAMRTLSVIGFVEVRSGEGTFVAERHADYVAKAFSWSVLFGVQTAREVVQTRVAIETELARLAADLASEDDISELYGWLEEMEKSIGNVERFLPADLEFHKTIVRAAGNQTLGRLHSASEALLRQWLVVTLNREGIFDVAVRHHRAIAHAIKDRDGAAADEAMRNHLEETGKLVVAAAEGARRHQRKASPPDTERLQDHGSSP